MHLWFLSNMGEVTEPMCGDSKMHYIELFCHNSSTKQSTDKTHKIKHRHKIIMQFKNNQELCVLCDICTVLDG